MHEHASDELRERAAAYVLGALDRDAAAALLAHVAAGCHVCRDEIAAFAAVTDDLALAVTPLAPPPSVRDRILADRAADRSAADVTGFVFRLEDEGTWREIAPGVSRRSLGKSPTAGSRTYLIRMTAGSTLPRHDHGVVEHCYILAGDFEVAGRRLGAGDYHLAARGTIHDGLRSDGGCTFLIVEAAS